MNERLGLPEGPDEFMYARDESREIGFEEHQGEEDVGELEEYGEDYDDEDEDDPGDEVDEDDPDEDDEDFDDYEDLYEDDHAPRRRPREWD